MKPESTPASVRVGIRLREGIHAKYCVETVTIPAGRLRAGSNTISLGLPSTREASGHVMYDYLCLETR